MSRDLEMLVVQIFFNVLKIKIWIIHSLSLVNLIIDMSLDNEIIAREPKVKGHLELLVFSVANNAGIHCRSVNKRYFSYTY
jgi:hypothetical protein